MTEIVTITFLLLTALVIGSFLNVVIHRGPIIWGLVDRPGDLPHPYSLAQPRSHCPKCKAQISLIGLIPVVGFLINKGRCANCGNRISGRYLLVEVTALLIGALAIYIWGVNWLALAAFIFGVLLLSLACIDWETGYLPDALTGPLLWIGLLINLDGAFTPLASAVIGAAAGYLTLRIVADAYRTLRKREGLGRGDAKLLAAIGAWVGWAWLPFVMLLAAILGLALVGAKYLSKQDVSAETELPFGPALALAGMVILALTRWITLIPA